VLDSTVVYVVECCFTTKDKLRIFNARTSTRFEEALGFKSLLELGEPAYTIATIASRAGKGEAYIYGRIKLADLIPPVAEAFLKDQITLGHALLIAKLPASQQQEAFSAAFRGLWTSEGNSQVLIPVRE
jgi:ParB family chromosome partitioning protein